ncbi:MAG: AAA family ATPase, partial [Chloroflexi bacterium]|nr:AAA family ATPase [Chloroflexota bacterium]
MADSNDSTRHKLDIAQLYRTCDLDQFDFETTADITSDQKIYGQERGATAIAFGIDIHNAGYNIYVLGPSGSGRLTAVEHFINERAQQANTPDDWCYVYNFSQANQPVALRLPAGRGSRFKHDMQRLIETLRAEIPQVFESDVYLEAQAEIKARLDEQSQKIFESMRQQAAEKSFSLQATQQGVLVIVPIVDGHPVAPEDFSDLPEEQQATFTAARRELEETIEEAFRQTRNLQREAEAARDTLRRDMARQVVEAHMAEVLKRYDTSGAAIQYLWAVQEDILEALDHFETDGELDEGAELEGPLPQLQRSSGDFFRRYEVNVFVENKPDSGAPVVILDLPTHQNLIGRIEHQVKYGVLSTDFTQIVSGALHRASGGFLIMRASDLLQQPFAWDALKRSLISEQVVIEDMQSRGVSVMVTEQLEPDPIPINVKVVLVGSPHIYYTLHALEEDFRDLFRVKADFVDIMERTTETETHYASFVANICQSEDLLHFDRAAVGRIIDYGSWLASDQRKLTATFGQITPVIYESVFFAQQNDHAVVTIDDVEKALAARAYRNNEAEQISHERIADGTIFLDFTGEVVGQVNALVVITSGDYIFGLPSRLTARVFSGRQEVVQIDRESGMTGPIHDKGVMILQGYLGGRYAQDYPLSLSASLTFEQSYGGVEGDSASSSELFALLSALSGFAIRQDIAVTGSVNQRGQIQPVGGVTQKVEGFFKACHVRGLTGTQGVIIPRANRHNLMLNDEVVRAVERGEFSIYAIETVDEGISLLTGKHPAAVHEAVDTRLRRFAETLASYNNH